MTETELVLILVGILMCLFMAVLLMASEQQND